MGRIAARMGQAQEEWDPFADPAEVADPSAAEVLTGGGATSSKARPQKDGDALEQPEEEEPEAQAPQAEPDYWDLDALEAMDAAFATQLMDAWGARQPGEMVIEQVREDRKGSPCCQVDDNDSLYSDDGPQYEAGGITRQFCEELLDWQKHGRLLSARSARQLVIDAIQLLEGLATLVDVAVPPGAEITVCGDVHGQYYDLLHIWDINGPPSESNPYLFNGDFVDRGSFSVEVVLALFAWKLLYPTHLHLARGNHETQNMNRLYGFEGEVRHKYDDSLYALLCEAFRLLPLCHVLNGCVFVVHGGLFSRDGVTLDEIRSINRVCEPDDTGLMVDMLWSDPQPGWGRSASKRGVGCVFGQDVTEDFLKTNALRLIIRSHEMCDEGYSVEHKGQLITVFSAPNYCDQMGNRGAVLRLDGDTLTPRPISFQAVPHPPVSAMCYAAPFQWNVG